MIQEQENAYLLVPPQFRCMWQGVYATNDKLLGATKLFEGKIQGSGEHSKELFHAAPSSMHDRLPRDLRSN